MGQLHFLLPDTPLERIKRLEEIIEELNWMISQAQEAHEASTQPELFEDNSNSTS